MRIEKQNPYLLGTYLPKCLIKIINIIIWSLFNKFRMAIIFFSIGWSNVRPFVLTFWLWFKYLQKGYRCLWFWFKHQSGYRSCLHSLYADSRTLAIRCPTVSSGLWYPLAMPFSSICWSVFAVHISGVPKC